MKSHRLTLLISSVLALLLVFTLSSCKIKEYPNPTKEYYVNDFAHAFHPITKKAIVLEGEGLYADTKDIEGIGGVQIVFATFIIENLDDIANYDRTDIFRQWKIGKNDMGILVLMFFTEGEEDGINYVYLEETQIEVGDNMESFFSGGLQGQMLDKTIYSDDYDDLDSKVAYLLYELLTFVYEDIYSEYYSSFTYDMEYFQDSMENYIPESSDTGLFFWLLYLFSGTNWVWFVLGTFGFMFIFKGVIFRNRGGGGSSSGYGIFRRR